MHDLAQPIPYRIVAVRDAFLARARRDGLDDLNQPVERMLAQGGEPCRDVLRRARAGEELILASYCPFRVAGPYREYGPVFVLANPQAGATPDRLPVDGAAPYLGASFVLRAYSYDERIVDAVITTPQEAAPQLLHMLEARSTSFVLARFAAYGCYALRIEHAGTS
jgi:hypothetical protein